MAFELEHIGSFRELKKWFKITKTMKDVLDCLLANLQLKRKLTTETRTLKMVIIYFKHQII